MSTRRYRRVILAALLGAAGLLGPPSRAGAERDWASVLTDVAGEVFLGAQDNVLFYAEDVLAFPNEPVTLRAHMQSLRYWEPIVGAAIGFYAGDDLLGWTATDANGVAALTWTMPLEGDVMIDAYQVYVNDAGDLVEPRGQSAPLVAAARDAESRFAVIDLDRTVVNSSFWRVLLGGAEPMPGSVTVLNELAERYSLVYLTHRPDLLARRSRSWLAGHGYPSGPLLVSSLGEALGSSGTYKTERLAALRAKYPRLEIGVGDKISDALAYVDNGMTAYLLPHYEREADEMLALADQIRRLGGHERLHVVSSWWQIEESVFEGRAFPAERFARRLERWADDEREDD